MLSARFVVALRRGAVAGLLLSLAWMANAAQLTQQVLINEIYFEVPDKRPLEFIELYNPGSVEIDLSDWKLEKFSFPERTAIPANGYVVVARNPAVFEREFKFKPLGPLPGNLKHHGEKVVLRDAAGKKVDEVRYETGFPWPTAAAGAGSSLERINPNLASSAPNSWRSSGFPLGGPLRDKRPTPGKQNSTFTTNSPLAIALVNHSPPQPHTGEPVTVMAEVGPAENVQSVTLQVQVVEPGAYIRKSDPAYTANWRDIPMHDDGASGDLRSHDGIFSAIVPGDVQSHRRLIRYRVVIKSVNGLVLHAPDTDDECPNFAYYCYDRFPAWTGTSQPGKTPSQTFLPDFLGTLPVYQLLADNSDVEHSQWDGNYNKRHLFGTLIYDGIVYDHIQYNNRGQASTYVSGKNKWGFHFNHTREFAARDMWGREYAKPWNNFNMNACASPWVQINRGMAGMDEAVSFRAYQLAGVPSPSTHWVHFRVVTRKEEASAKNQYEGDLWGLYLVVQEPDGSLLRERDLPDGTIYSAETGRHHQGRDMPLDGSDWNAFMDKSRSTSDEQWWRNNLDLPIYYSFHSINRVVSNVDLRQGGNHYFYHQPNNHWAVVPWDLDMMFIPKTHWPGIIDQARCLEVPNIRRDFQSRAREVIDLFCSDPAPNGGQVGQLVDELARVLCPPGQARTWPELDMDLWNYNPHTSDKGAFYRNPARQGMSGGEFERKLATPDFAGFRKYIVDFATDSRAQKNYAVNDGDSHGYGFGFLWNESKDASIPDTPKIHYTGTKEFSPRELSFEVSSFVSPKNASKFAAVQWRIGTITAPGLPGYKAGEPQKYEIEPFWISEPITEPTTKFELPPQVCHPGSVYRMRARYQDQSGRWSHWSPPVQFVTNGN